MDREAFIDLHPLRLLCLLDSHIGRSEAQSALDRLAAKRNMIREPQYAGRWS